MFLASETAPPQPSEEPAAKKLATEEIVEEKAEEAPAEPEVQFMK